MGGHGFEERGSRRAIHPIHQMRVELQPTKAAHWGNKYSSPGKMVQRDQNPTSGELSKAVLVLLALGHCAAFADRNLLAVAAPLLKTQMGLSDAQLGILMGPAFVVLYVVGMLASLRMSASRQRFRLLALCIAVWVVGMVSFALAQSFEGLFIARVLVGLGQSAYVPLALGLIVESVASRRRGRSMAVFTAGSVIGRSLALLLGGLTLALLARHVLAPGLASWRMMFLIMAVPNLLLMAALLFCRDSGRRFHGTMGGFARVFGWMRRHPSAMALYFCAAGGSVLVVQTVGAWASSVLNREQGLTPAHAALVFGAALLFASPMGHLLAGALVDARRKRWTPTDVTAIGLVLAIPLLWALPYASSPQVSCLLMALISLLAGAAAVATLAGLPAMLPESLHATSVRVFLIFITVTGTTLGPFLAGLVSDHMDELAPGTGGLSAALRLVCISVAICAIAAAWFARNGWRRATAEASA